MDFSILFVFVTWTTSMSYSTYGKERHREMLFPQYYFFAERRLLNHTIRTVLAKDLDQCEFFCYLNDDCVSLNIKKDRDSGTHVCELNNSTHQEHDADLIFDSVFYYRGSKNACGKNPPCHNNATCQSGFTDKGYRCSCTTGFKGEYCKEVDVCQNYKILDEVRRDINHKTDNGGIECDVNFNNDWYRFLNVDGITMATSCPKQLRCGRANPGWLKTAHPTVTEGKVQREVCFRKQGNCCEQSKFIKVKNCGSYYVYYLVKEPNCSYGYCYNATQRSNPT